MTNNGRNIERRFKIGSEIRQIDPDEEDRKKADKIYYNKVQLRLESITSGKPVRSREDQAKLNRLYDHANQNGINVDNIFKHTEDKRKALGTIMRYRSIRGAQTLAQADPENIGKVYKRLYNTT